jgi:hypothetical protein
MLNKKVLPASVAATLMAVTDLGEEVVFSCDRADDTIFFAMSKCM